jgi:hypothetical protein
MGDEELEPSGTALTPRRRKGDNFPEWAKFAITIVATTIAIIGWAEARFVSRVEWTNHDKQQIVDMARLQSAQADYARAEVVTGQGLTDLKVDVAEIKGDVSWLRSYLDVNVPSPRRNGKRGTP